MIQQEKTVLYYTENLFKQNQIAGLCRQLGFRSRRIRTEDAGLPVGSLAGAQINRGKPAPGSGQDKTEKISLPEMLIFCGLTDEELDRILEAYRLSGIAPIALKAILTPHNFLWSVSDLARELEREHRTLH